MSDNLFRQKSIKRMQSPENLNEYIKVINPSLWIVFIAAFLLLTGAFVWGSVGKIEDKTTIIAVSQNSSVMTDYNENVKSGMKAVVNDTEGHVQEVTPNGIKMTFDTAIPDGVFSGYIVTGLISPISFVFN